jgi:hypothetical protein
VDQCALLLKEIGATIVRGPIEGTWAPGYYYVLFEDPVDQRGIWGFALMDGAVWRRLENHDRQPDPQPEKHSFGLLAVDQTTDLSRGFTERFISMPRNHAIGGAINVSFGNHFLSMIGGPAQGQSSDRPQQPVP